MVARKALLRVISLDITSNLGEILSHNLQTLLLSFQIGQIAWDKCFGTHKSGRVSIFLLHLHVQNLFVLT